MQFPSNLDLLHDGEEEIRQRSVAVISADETLSMHVTMIERVMDMLQFVREDYDEQSEDQLIVKLLGARLFNDMAAALKLILGGYYQASVSHIRDIVETSFLLDYFSLDPAFIQQWKSVSEEDRNKKFNQAAIRKALDARDGFTEARRYEHYKMLCGVGAHPTMQGFGMLRPETGAPAHMGAFFVPALLDASLVELVKVAVIASGCFRQFFEPSTITQFRASIAHLETASQWKQAVFGPSDDNEKIAHLRRILSELEAE